MSGPRPVDELLEEFPKNKVVREALIKTHDHISRAARNAGKILVSVSGGSDSDIILDFFERIGYPDGLVYYAWYDTGLEYEATKRHLRYLEERYGVTIHRHRGTLTVAQAVKRYGAPFRSKKDSQYIGYLQRHDFGWEEICNNGYKADEYWWNGNGRISVGHSLGLKEFMIANPPEFRISDQCCYHTKKKTSAKVEKEIGATLVCMGMRKAEGGVRSVVLDSCFSEATNKRVARFYPIFWFSDEDKQEYKEYFGIAYSDCYEKWGFKRTGCACCPFASNFEEELAIVKVEEPKLYAAANKIFGESYEYSRRFREFKTAFKKERSEKLRIAREKRKNEKRKAKRAEERARREAEKQEEGRG